MWTLIAAQLRYYRTGLTAGFITTFAAASFVTWIGRPERPGIWMLVVLGLGGFANLWMWIRDQQERRMMTWANLPVPFRTLAAARLLLPFLVQGAVGVLAVVGLSLAQMTVGHVDPEDLAQLLGSQAFTLLAILAVYLHEELSVLAGPSRWAAIAINLLIAAIFLPVAFHMDDLFLSWPGVFLGHGLAVLLASAAYTLFVRRPSYLVGVSPLTGFPKDWSEANAGR